MCRPRGLYSRRAVPGASAKGLPSAEVDGQVTCTERTFRSGAAGRSHLTCLVAWIGQDSNGPSTAYIASDSLVTWAVPQEGKPVVAGRWAHAAKVVGSSKQPVIAGYCGDSIFGTTTLVQLMAMMDSGEQPASYETTVESAAEIIGASHNAYPHGIRSQFILAFRSKEDEFQFFEIACNPNQPVSLELLTVDRKTGLVGSWGSGASSYKSEHERWQKSDVAGYSRAIACAFCDAVASGRDDRTGGPPQIVGLYRKGAAVVHGLVIDGRRFFSGMEVSEDAVGKISCPIEWRNKNFERCDPLSMTPLDGAQLQPRPRNVT